MMTETSFRIPLLVWTSWLVLSLLLQAGPEGLRERMLSTLQTSMSIVLELTHPLFRQDDSATAAESSASSTLEQLQAENRTLAKLIADLQLENTQLKQAAPALLAGEAPSLVKYDAIPARIVGQRGDALSDSLQLLISIGKEQSLNAGELVMTGQGLLIDQGTTLGLTPDQFITAGRGLFGRTVQVGAQTTLVQPITDPQFRMAVRIVRRSPLGAIQGPQGILAGTGNGCRLDEVTSTEAVATGDEVYTDRLVSPGAEPIYCGRVVRADAEPGANHWTIEVDPLHSKTSLPATLFVMRAGLNEERLNFPVNR